MINSTCVSSKVYKLRDRRKMCQRKIQYTRTCTGNERKSERERESESVGEQGDDDNDELKRTH